MSDLLFLLRWLHARRGIYVGWTPARSDSVGREWLAIAWLGRGDGATVRAKAATPLRALRALAQQLQKEDR